MEDYKWSPDELNLLIQTCNEYSSPEHVDWGYVSTLFPGKEMFQCQSRYLKVVNRDYIQGRRFHAWTSIEEEILINAVYHCGRNWEELCTRFLPWLTPTKLKNKYYVLRRMNRVIDTDKDHHARIAMRNAIRANQARAISKLCGDDIVNIVKRMLSE